MKHNDSRQTLMRVKLLIIATTKLRMMRRVVRMALLAKFIIGWNSHRFGIELSPRFKMLASAFRENKDDCFNCCFFFSRHFSWWFDECIAILFCAYLANRKRIYHAVTLQTHNSFALRISITETGLKKKDVSTVDLVKKCSAGISGDKE